MLKRLATWWAMETAIQRLAALDDRMLDDMGLTREEIRTRVLAREAPTDHRSGPLGGLPEIVS